MRTLLALILCLTLSAAPPALEQLSPDVVWSKPCRTPVDTIWAVDNLRFVVARSNTTLEMLDSRDGRVVWTKTFPNAQKAIWIAPLNLLLVPDRGRTIAINAVSGTQSEWPGGIKSHEFIPGLNAIVGHTGGKRLFLGDADGKLRWEASFKEKIDGVLSYTGLPESSVCLVLARKAGLGYLASVDLATGSVGWETPLKSDVGDPLADQRIVPVVKDGFVYVEMDGLSKIDLRTGGVQWYVPYGTTENRGKSTFLTGHNAPPVFHGQDVLTAAKGRIRRIDLKTGKVLWRSKDYALTPQISVQGDSVIGVTGGMFYSVVYGMSAWNIVFAAAMGAASGLATGWVVMPMTMSLKARPHKLMEVVIEGQSLNGFLESIVRRGHPGIALVSAGDGKEIRWIRSEGGAFAGLDIAGQEMLVGDSDGIWRFDAGAGDPARADRLAVPWEAKGGNMHWFIRLEGGDLVAVSGKGGDAHVMQRLKPAGQTFTPIWTARLPRDVSYPELLTRDADHVYVLSYYQVTAVELQSGKVAWNVEVPDRGWSVYPGQGALVYYAKNDKKLLFCRHAPRPSGEAAPNPAGRVAGQR